ncbi:flagellar biosynthesis protein FlhB [Staphylococcus caledonicus]
MTLLSGAMATLLDGDLKYASNRSVTMHSIRNFLSALLVPIVTYILKDDIQKGLQTLYSGYTTHIANKFVLTQKIQDVIIHSNQKIFTLMLIFNVVMLISSIIQIFLGKGRRITPKS